MSKCKTNDTPTPVLGEVFEVPGFFGGVTDEPIRAEIIQEFACGEQWLARCEYLGIWIGDHKLRVMPNGKYDLTRDTRSATHAENRAENPL